MCYGALFRVEGLQNGEIMLYVVHATAQNARMHRVVLESRHYHRCTQLHLLSTVPSCKSRMLLCGLFMKQDVRRSMIFITKSVLVIEKRSAEENVSCL